MQKNGLHGLLGNGPYPEFVEDAPTHPFLRRWDHKETIGALSVLDAVGEKTANWKTDLRFQFAPLAQLIPPPE